MTKKDELDSLHNQRNDSIKLGGVNKIIGEPFDLEKSASDIAEIYLKDPELQYVALVKCIVDLCRRCQDEAYENSAKIVEKSAIDFTPFSMPFIIEEILALRSTTKDEGGK